MNKKDQDILKEGEIKGRKDLEKSFIATETEEKEVSPSSDQRPDEPSQKGEIDVSCAAAGSNASNKLAPSHIC